jgi:hypothetical protein
MTTPAVLTENVTWQTLLDRRIRSDLLLMGGAVYNRAISFTSGVKKGRLAYACHIKWFRNIGKLIAPSVLRTIPLIPSHFA